MGCIIVYLFNIQIKKCLTFFEISKIRKLKFTPKNQFFKKLFQFILLIFKKSFKIESNTNTLPLKIVQIIDGYDTCILQEPRHKPTECVDILNKLIEY